MNRLTCKPDRVMENYYYETTEETINEDRIAILNKLGQLEDLMEKYNIKTLEQVESSFIGFVTDYTEEGRNHIGELLKLEDELGIDLITLFKAIKDGFYDNKGNYYQSYDYSIELGSNCLKETFEDYMNGKAFNFEDYGKTWALTKEELE